MKKILLFVIALTLGFGVKAQCPLSTAVDFTATDVHGTEVHLFDILDNGQYVLLDFFFTTCSACIQTIPYMVQSYQSMGCNLHDVFYMEVDTGDDEQACLNWANNHGVEYPTIAGASGGTSICSQYGIGYYPTIILIAPDHSIVIQDLWPVDNAQSVISALEAHGLEQHDCTPPVADIMPDFTGTDIDGNEINLYSILDGGQAALLYFFLTGDEYSQTPMEDVVNAFHQYGCNEHDVYFIEISPNGHDDDCSAWAEQFEVQYPTISRDGGGNDIAQAIPVGFYPTLMLVRPNHEIAVRDIYPPTYDFIAQAFGDEGYEEYYCVTSIEEDKATYSLFPNPANERVTLKGENLGTVSVYNALGQKMDEFDAEDSELSINTSQYQSGVYFIKMNGKTLRFVVNH